MGKVSTGTAHYAKREDSPTIYTLPSYTTDWALADVAKFQKAADAGAPKPSGSAKPASGDAHGGDPHGH